MDLLVIEWFVGLLGNCFGRRWDEPKQVDVLGERGRALRRELDNYVTGRTANRLGILLREVDEASLAGSVAASEYARYCALSVVGQEAHRALR